MLNVASAAGLLSLPEAAPYNVTKSAVVALSRTMRGELHGTGVSVSVLCPSFFRSQIYAGARTRADLGSMTEGLVKNAGWGASEVAEVALRGLESGKLHVIPQWDAWFIWHLQRIWPAGVQWLLGWLHRKQAFESWARRRTRPDA